MKFKATYDGNHDTFRVEFLVVPVGGLSFLVNHDFSPLEVSQGVSCGHVCLPREIDVFADNVGRFCFAGVFSWASLWHSIRYLV